MAKTTKLAKKTLDGNIQTLLLAVLSDAPSYGYAIVQELNRRGEGLLKMGEGTVYPVLYRMEERGLVEAYWEKGSNGRRRKYYRNTAAGKRALAVDQQQWQGLVTLMERVFSSDRGDVSNKRASTLTPYGGLT